jgi:hypothetical protein
VYCKDERIGCCTARLCRHHVWLLDNSLVQRWNPWLELTPILHGSHRALNSASRTQASLTWYKYMPTRIAFYDLIKNLACLCIYDSYKQISAIVTPRVPKSRNLWKYPLDPWMRRLWRESVMESSYRWSQEDSICYNEAKNGTSWRRSKNSLEFPYLFIARCRIWNEVQRKQPADLSKVKVVTSSNVVMELGLGKCT